MQNVILTGIPRSGTTLLTALIDSIPNAAALNEPRWHYDGMMKWSAEDFAKWLVGDFAAMRHELLRGIPIPERRLPDGTAATNYYRQHPEQRDPLEIVKDIPFTRPGLTSDFLLAMKHNGVYFGVLPQLAELEHFTIIAIIREPVSVISSWQTVPIPMREGKMPGAVGHWKAMRELTQAPIDLLEKQVKIYDLLCRRLYSLRERIHIIKYEELADNPNIAGAILGYDVSAFSPRIKKRKLDFYGNSDKIAEAVARYGQYCRYFYPNACSWQASFT